MIVLGIILLIIGLIVGVPVLYSIGIALAVIGAVLDLLGFAGWQTFGRRHWF